MKLVCSCSRIALPPLLTRMSVERWIETASKAFAAICNCKLLTRMSVERWIETVHHKKRQYHIRLLLTRMSVERWIETRFFKELQNKYPFTNSYVRGKMD